MIYQCLQATQNRIDLRQKQFHLRENLFLYGLHHVRFHPPLDYRTGFQIVIHILVQMNMQFTATKKTVHDRNIATFINFHMVFQADINRNLIDGIIIINNLTHQTDFKAFYKYRTRNRHSLYIRTSHYIMVCRFKQIDPFQVINS